MSTTSDLMAPTVPTPRVATGGVQTIQFLRFVAAGMVLLAHVSFFIHHRVDPDVRVLAALSQGVALFFVISGFIMTVTASSRAGEPGYVRYFVLSRLIRIVPLYWAINAAKLLGFFLVPGLIAANPTVSNVLYSLLFLPAKNADGKIEAFYGVGWSLNFEMAFYAIFALVHTMCGALAVVVLHGLTPWMPFSSFFILGGVFCLALSAASFLNFERPVTRWLLKRRKTVTTLYAGSARNGVSMTVGMA